MLEMINVTYAYKSKKEIVHVLDKVTYRFEIGEMYGIFGPSGSGKTTCLSLLAGLEKPDEGEILLDGENIQNIGGRKLRQNAKKGRFTAPRTSAARFTPQQTASLCAKKPVTPAAAGSIIRCRRKLKLPRRTKP